MESSVKPSTDVSGLGRSRCLNATTFAFPHSSTSEPSKGDGLEASVPQFEAELTVDPAEGGRRCCPRASHSILSRAFEIKISAWNRENKGF